MCLTERYSYLNTSKILKCCFGDFFPLFIALHDFEESEEINLWEVPETCGEKVIFFLMWIPNFLFSITIPRCDLPGRIKLFPVTFFTSICWLGALSYMCFWMVAVIGKTVSHFKLKVKIF